MNVADLITDVELATEFGMDLDTFHRRRRARGWPCVKLDRSTFRFTPLQREQIIAMQSVGGAAAGSPLGQTARSAARRRSA